MQTPAFLIGQPLGESGLRQKYSVTVVCIKPVAGVYTYATPESILGEDDLMVISTETCRAIQHKSVLMRAGLLRCDGRHVPPWDWTE